MRAWVLLAGLACQADPVVDVEWLRAAQRRLGARLVVAEASWAADGSAPQYAAGHIPGAIHINTDVFENGRPSWHLRPVPELHAALGRLGIGPETTVVVYSQQTIAAARVWWVMEYAGVRDVRYLDGGLGAWKRAGLPADTATVFLPPVRFSGRPRPQVLATTARVRQARNAVLADVRSVAEFRGETSGYSYLDAKGRIPGAISAGNADDATRLYQNPDGTLRRAEEIRALWQRTGILTGGEVIFYCGSGWRSSLAYLYARRLGLRRVRNYSDGWSGWSTIFEPGGGQRPSRNPVERR
ncbi:MAG: sulfurtransferase [Acidobacteria bacterium]|nr:sulfurtransferase [Acidobacteriota bacterium]